MATLLNTGLDRETLGLCVSLCERGVNPEALAVKLYKLFFLTTQQILSCILFFRVLLKIYVNKSLPQLNQIFTKKNYTRSLIKKKKLKKNILLLFSLSNSNSNET